MMDNKQLGSTVRQMLWELRWGFAASATLAVILLSMGASCVRVH